MRAAAICAAIVAALSPLTTTAAADVPLVLRQPAQTTPRALAAATLAVARAGSRLVAVGERGTVLCSDDGGKSWRQASVPVEVTLTNVRFANDHTGWAVGHLGVILKTDDGGLTWVKQLDGVQLAEVVRTAAGSDDAARRDAEHLAQDGPDKPFFDIEVLDPQYVVVVGAYGLAFATHDGGLHWSPLPVAAANPKRFHLYGVRVVGHEWFIVGEQGMALRSSDDGATFSVMALPYKGSLFGLVAADSGTLVAYGLRGNAWRSADRGQTWNRVDLDTQVSFEAGLTSPKGGLVLLGQTGDLYVSQDDGRTFARTPTPAGALPAAGLSVAPDGAWIFASLRGTRRVAAAH